MRKRNFRVPVESEGFDKVRVEEGKIRHSTIFVHNSSEKDIKREDTGGNNDVSWGT